MGLYRKPQLPGLELKVDQLQLDVAEMGETIQQIESSVIINVQEHGLKGDGVSDDTWALNTLLATYKNEPCYLMFPKGTYLLSGKILLYSNTVLDFNHATINPNGASVLFLNNDDSVNQTGYGAIKNIAIKSGYFLSTGNYNFKFALMHAENVNVVNNQFVGIHGDHVFDLGGCKNVTIDNCHFTNTSLDSSHLYVEMIQLDYALYDGQPYWDSSSIGYDGLACQNISVTNCIFEKGGGSHEPNAIGAHGFFTEQHDGLYIANNRFNGWTYAAIRPLRTTNITIENNEFLISNISDTLHAILIEPACSTSYTFIAGENIHILNNRFTASNATKRHFIYIHGDSISNLHKGIIIAGNQYKGTYDGLDNNSGSDFLQIDYVSDVQIYGNIVKDTKNFIYSPYYLVNCSIQDNLLIEPRTFMNIQNSVGLTYDNNNVIKSNKSGIYRNTSNVITAYLESNHTTNTVDTAEKLVFTANNKSGEMLSLSNGGVVIGKGVTQVKISGLTCVNTASNSLHTLSIKRNREGTTVTLGAARIKSDVNYQTCTIPIKVVDVQEGDIITAYVISGSVGQVVGTTSFLTVEVV